jgi:hypothetical protein
VALSDARDVACRLLRSAMNAVDRRYQERAMTPRIHQSVSALPGIRPSALLLSTAPSPGPTSPQS